MSLMQGCCNNQGGGNNYVSLVSRQSIGHYARFVAYGLSCRNKSEKIWRNFLE